MHGFLADPIARDGAGLDSPCPWAVPSGCLAHLAEVCGGTPARAMQSLRPGMGFCRVAGSPGIPCAVRKEDSRRHRVGRVDSAALSGRRRRPWRCFCRMLECGAELSPAVDLPSPMSVALLIRRYGLQPHPEGGWYREMHRSQESVQRRDGESRTALTAILFLLPQGEISRWHRVSAADETWHHAGGAPLELFCLPPSGGALRRQRLASVVIDETPERSQGDLGEPEDQGVDGHVQRQAEPLAIVPAGWWQAARTLGDWSLVSCCVGPGFDFSDFTMLRDLPPQRRPRQALPELL